jgi:hypothetical protein
VKDFFDEQEFITIEAPKRPILMEANIEKRLEFALRLFDDVNSSDGMRQWYLPILGCEKSPLEFLGPRKTL